MSKEPADRREPPSAPLLRVDGVSVRFGGVVALDAVSFSVPPGQICALIGPNGAGKTTLFNVVSRLTAVTSGGVTYAGHDLLALPAHRMAGLGIARTFQNVALFPARTVLENVMVGGHAHGRSGPVRAMLRIGIGAEERRLRTKSRVVLDRLGLGGIADRPAASLPFGTQKRVELARALVAEPRLLLLDEPANGLARAEVDELAATISDIRQEFDTTVLLVEHHMAMVMAIADHVVVLDFGRTIAEGPPHAVAQDPTVIEAYLGTPA